MTEIVVAFNKRSKALEHQNCRLEIAKEIDDGSERLNIDCRGLESPPVQTRISFWPDGGPYFRKCQAAKSGWRFNIDLHGYAHDVTPEDIVELFESSLGIENEEELMSIWQVANPFKQ